MEHGLLAKSPRIEVVDALRGFAVMAIMLLHNIEHFNFYDFPTASSAFMEAMSTDAIDLGTVGPTPALTSYMKTPKHQIISGAVNGGAVLVVGKDSGINSVKDLAGKTVAIPTFGSTQDIALMKALKEADLKVKSSGGNVNTVKQAPADTAAFRPCFAPLPSRFTSCAARLRPRPWTQWNRAWPCRRWCSSSRNNPSRPACPRAARPPWRAAPPLRPR